MISTPHYAERGHRSPVFCPKWQQRRDRLIQICSDHRLFLKDTNFCRKRWHRLTWFPPSPAERSSQTDHIVIHRWPGQPRITLVKSLCIRYSSLFVQHGNADPSVPHSHTLIMLQALLLSGPSSRQNEAHVLWPTTLADFRSVRHFQRDCLINKLPGIRANTEIRSKEHSTQRQLTRRTPCNVNLGCGGCPRLQSVRWIFPGRPSLHPDCI